MPPQPTPYARSICRAGGWSTRTVHAGGFQLETAGAWTTRLRIRMKIPRQCRRCLPLSYMPSNALPADVLRMGAFFLKPAFPSAPDRRLNCYLVYSDGSGVESYRCDHGSARWGGRQLASGDVVFTHGASLARFTSPLAHEAARRCSACRVRGRDCRDGLGRLAGERARRGRHALRAQDVEAAASSLHGACKPC